MPTDPLTLGQQLVAVLEGGHRTATYKLAVMVALLDLAVESVPDDPGAAVSIDLDDLTERVMALYWTQLRPLDEKSHVILRQSNDGRGVVFSQLTALRAACATARLRQIPIESAKMAVPQEYQAAQSAIKKNLVRYPLKLLQRVGTGTYECFLYDDSWLGTDSTRVIDAHGNQIELFPGVCHTLARLAPLVKPAFQLAWVDDVRRMNREVLGDEPDIAAHLFGTERVSLARPAEVLADHFGNDCFYCGTRLGAGRHVDHVLPWSRVGIDGLTNLVLACQSCNSSKSDLLPAPAHVTRALDRGRVVLDSLAETIHWPSQFDRVVSASHGLYSTQPSTTPTWYALKRIEPLQRGDFRWTDAQL
ncbi:HNH endonuclease [Gordonia sp. i37]|uniref:HNH endonuclease n=1 Tax=Gordonia sp. i37 TaxID=1961707 RepID=UPI0009AD233C|nr:HNH endonuclease [Gordonia sp. i37]OPX13645.1 HNH endonuclease [Gordonia sp. i37]